MILVDAAAVRCIRKAHDRVDDERSSLPTLVLPRRGVFRYHTRRQTAIADANTVLLFHPDEPYRVSHPTDAGDDCIALRFDQEAVADALGFASESGGAWTLDAQSQRAVHRSASAVLGASDALARDEQALDVLALVSATGPLAVNARDAARIDAVRERLAVDPGAQVSLAILARDAGISPFHLARRFRTRTGTSLQQYRLQLRLGVAFALLRDGADNLTRVALDLGFASPAHFSAAFGNAYGFCPSTVLSPRRRRLPGHPARSRGLQVAAVTGLQQDVGRQPEPEMETSK